MRKVKEVGIGLLLVASILVNAYQYAARIDLFTAHSNLSKVIESFEGQGATTRSFSVLGEFDHLLTYNEKKGVVNSIWDSVGCKGRQGVISGRHINVCSEVDGLPASIMASGQKVNLNLALRDDLTKRKTVIAIASPVIINEY